MNGARLVIGGSGFIGTHLVDALVAQGHEVHHVDLVQPRTTAGTFHIGDVRAPLNLDLPGPINCVYNLAAVHRTPGHADESYYDTNVSGALHVAHWARQNDVKQMVFTSSIAVYGPTENPLDEKSALTPNSPYGKSKLMAEQIHRDWQAESGDRQLVIVRPAVIFGPGEHGNVTRLARALSRGRFVYPGREDTIKACGYVKDLISAIDFLLERGEPSVTANFAYPESYTIKDMCEAMITVAGFAPPRSLPPVVAKAIVELLRCMPLPTAGRLASRVRKLQASTHIQPTALQGLGFTWDTDLECALTDWFASHPHGELV